MDVNFVKALVSKYSALILDVRTEEEYCLGHLCSSLHIETPLPPLDRKNIRNLAQKLMYTLFGTNKNRPIIVYCKKGIRANYAKDILKNMGYKNVYNLGGVEINPLKKYFSGRKYYKELKLCKCLM